MMVMIESCTRTFSKDELFSMFPYVVWVNVTPHPEHCFPEPLLQLVENIGEP